VQFARDLGRAEFRKIRMCDRVAAYLEVTALQALQGFPVQNRVARPFIRVITPLTDHKQRPRQVAPAQNRGDDVRSTGPGIIDRDCNLVGSTAGCCDLRCGDNLEIQFFQHIELALETLE